MCNDWVERQTRTAIADARAMWREGWSLLSHEQRMAFVSMRALAIIGANDEPPTPAMAIRLNTLAVAILSLTEKDL